MKRQSAASESASGMTKGCASRRDPRSGRSSGSGQRFRGVWQGSAAPTACAMGVSKRSCFLRSFVLLAPRQARWASC